MKTPPKTQVDTMPAGKYFALAAEVLKLQPPPPYVWLIGRTKTDGPPDYDAVHKIQAGYKVTLLSECAQSRR